MSKKRKSPETSNDEQTLEGSDSAFQREDNNKREKLVSLSDTTLQDLPVELIDCILVKAVAMEVKAMKLVKSVWKEKADLVINRLRTVSLQWSSILSTNFFRNELHRTLYGHAQETIRWEILLHPSIQSYVSDLAVLRDEVFMICQHGSGLNVYDRSNMAQAKDVIPLSEIYLAGMAACNLSNCVYLLNADMSGPSVIRITNDERQFRKTVWIKKLKPPCSDLGRMSVSANGSLIIFSRQPCPKPTVVRIYDANGFVQHEIRLSPEVFICLVNVIQKSNGNLLLISGNAPQYDAKLSEIDTSGRIIREYQSSLRVAGVKSFEDVYGRIVVYFSCNRIELLDSEFNLLDIAVPQLDNGQRLFPYQMHYNRERHEMVAIHYNWVTNTSALVTFRFTEE